MTRHSFIAALLGAAALSACDKDAVQEIGGPAPAARIRFFHFGVGAPSSGVNFYVDNTKATGTSSTTGQELATGTAYGGVGSGGFYAGISPGQHQISARIPSTAATDPNLAISTLTTTIDNGKTYSFYLSGTYNATTKTVDSFIVEDPIPSEIDFQAATVRFVNAISNSSPMTLYAKATTPDSTVYAIGGDVAYKAAGTFTKIPGGSYNLYTRTAGSTTNVIVRNGVAFTPGRVYTIAARGTIGATGTPVPFLDNTANR